MSQQITIESDLPERPPMARVRVLFYLFFPSSGIARYTHEQLKSLNRFDDLDLELACLESYDWADEATYRIWPHLRGIAHRRPWRRRVRFLTAQLINPRRACRRARAVGVDIMHFANINHLTYPFWRPALNASRAKVVATVHDVRRQKAMVNRRYEDQQLRNFYRRADALFVHGQNQVDELNAFAGVEPSRVHVVPHGLLDYGPSVNEPATLRSRFGLPLEKQVALFFGNIRDEKNLDLMLRALAGFRSSLHLLVAGRDGAKGQKTLDYYQSLAKELGVQDCVTFLSGYLPDERVPELFSVADWVALPYSRRFTSQSGVLNVAVQYQRAVVISAAPTFEETIRVCDVGVLVAPDDLGSLEKGIREMCTRIEQGHEHQFDKYHRMFGWEENARRTRAVYQRLLAEPTGPRTP